MLGHVFWDEAFTRGFLAILEREYDLPQTAGKLWESIYMEHLDELKMRIRRYEPGVINEFDTLDDLREFDASYVTDARSPLLAAVAGQLGVAQADISHVVPLKDATAAAVGFAFACGGKQYQYRYETGSLTQAAPSLA